VEVVKNETCLEYLQGRLSEGWRLISLEGYNAVLLSPGGIRRELDLRNDTETLRPDDPGSECSISSQIGAACPNHYQNVDEVEADTNTTVGQYGSSFERDLYNLPASSGSGTINKITVYFRCKNQAGTSGEAQASIKSNSTVTDGDTEALTTSWTTYSMEWATNPANGAWEWSDIDALEIGVRIRDASSIGVWCTQVYVEVDYTPVVAKPRSHGYIMG